MAPARAPAATSTPLENRCFGFAASADPFPPAADNVVRPHPIHGWTGVGVNTPTAQPASGWFAGDEAEGWRIRATSWGNAVQTRPACNPLGMEEEGCIRPADRRNVSRTLAEVNKVVKI